MDYGIGQAIRNKIAEKGMTIKWFADKFGITDRNIQHFFKKDDITLDQITRASEILGYDFVSDYFRALKNKGKAENILCEPEEKYTPKVNGITVSLNIVSDINTYTEHFSGFLSEVHEIASVYGFKLN